MQSRANKSMRGLTAVVLFIGAAVSSISVSHDASAQRRSQNRQDVQPYYYGGFAGPEFSARSPGYGLTPFTGSRDGRFDPVPPSANGG